MSCSGGQQDRLQKHGPEKRAPVDLNELHNTGWSKKKQGLYGIATRPWVRMKAATEQRDQIIALNHEPDRL
jgi:hypothetical protein